MKLAARGAARAAVEQLAASRAANLYEPPSIRPRSLNWGISYLMAQRRADARREGWRW